jgi:hypothetical protein
MVEGRTNQAILKERKDRSKSLGSLLHLGGKVVEPVLARGPNFVYAREFVQQEHGVSTWDEVAAALPDEARSIWTGNLLVTDAYPFEAFKAMPRALAEVVGARQEEELASMYSYVADRSLNSVYKFFFRLAEPSFVISRYPVLWQRFFDSGTVRVPVARSRHARLEFDLPEIFLDWLRPACLGYSSKAVGLSGGQKLELEDADMSQLGDDLWRVCYELSWDE